MSGITDDVRLARLTILEIEVLRRIAKQVPEGSGNIRLVKIAESIPVSPAVARSAVRMAMAAGLIEYWRAGRWVRITVLDKERWQKEFCGEG